MNQSGCDGISCQGFVAVAHLEKKQPVIQEGKEIRMSS